MFRFLLATLAFGATHAFLPKTVSSRRASSSVLLASPNPVIKLMSSGMGLIKPVFGIEAKLQAAALGTVAGVGVDDATAEIEADKKASKVVIYTYKLSPFSTEALGLLDSLGYEYTNIELGLEWFALGGMGSQKRIALSEMVENGATSLPKIFIAGKPLGGASGYSALAEAIESGEIEGLMKAGKAPKKEIGASAHGMYSEQISRGVCLLTLAPVAPIYDSRVEQQGTGGGATSDITPIALSVAYGQKRNSQEQPSLVVAVCRNGAISPANSNSD